MTGDTHTGVGTPDRVVAALATGLLEQGPEDTFNRITRLAAILLATPMVALTVVDDHRSWLKGSPAPEALCGPDGTFERPVDEAACQVVVEAGSEVSVPDVQLDSRLRDLPQIKEFGARAWIGVPIHDPAGYVVGNLCAMDPDVRQWTDLERESLRTLASMVDSEIALREAVRTAERNADEARRLAAILEESLIPTRPPALPGVDIAGTFRAAGTASAVLGDFYDVIPQGGGFAVSLGDVSGHGALAARTTAMARSSLRTAAYLDPDPHHVLRTANAVLREWFDEQVALVTAVYATLRPDEDPSRWQVTLASSGHPPAFVRRADGTVETLRGGGTVLGVVPDAAIDIQQLVLRAGDALVLYTDGITEARPPGSSDQFDEHRVVDILAAPFAPRDAAAIAEALLRAALGHGGGVLDDDAGIVVVRIPTATR